MNKELIRQFSNPTAEFRGAPFWAWNGQLEAFELRRQIRLMKTMGLGGFFMHSRVGLKTPYLSREWFDCVRACVDEARQLNMKAWLYDEDRWPSGAAGGIVTENPRFRMRSLVMEEMDSVAGLRRDAHVIAVFRVRLQGSTMLAMERLTTRSRPRLNRGEKLLVFRVEVQPCSPWYNGQAYLDTMNPLAVRKFLRVTHEAYRREIGTEFGKTVPGIFTDEPHHGRVCSQKDECHTSCPWTDRLPAVFRRRYGYDLVARLPELFFDMAGQPLSAVRYHYHDCITHLFVEAFARQVGEWCRQHGLAFTGHVLEEDTLSSQTNSVGSCMRFYEHMQVPGMDLLMEYNRIYDTAKQVASVARQFERRWRLTETYGCTGWDFPFVGHKALGDWQTALGINLRCQHLAWYTMEGQAKRDYPAAIFYQSPWWQLYTKVEDYFARIYAVMTRGEEVRDILVIHPNESMWTLTRKGWLDDPAVHALDRMLVALRDSLLNQNLDFDYGDEELLARHARVISRNGQALLQVGKAEYCAVVVPSQRTIRGTTLALLRRFRQSGGAVVFAGSAPEYVDARPSRQARELAAKCIRAPARGAELARTVAQVARRIAIVDASGRQLPALLHLLREDADAAYFFVCNTGHTPAQLKADNNDPTMVRDRRNAYPDVRIRGFDGCEGVPLLADPETGAFFTARAVRRGAGWEIRTSLAPLQSRLFIVPKKKTEQNFPPLHDPKTLLCQKLPDEPWEIKLSESNVVVFDRPTFQIDEGPWRAADEILRVDTAVRKHLGLEQRGGEMVQPWVRSTRGTARTATVRLRYVFHMKAVPSGELFLALEAPQTFTIAINDHPVNGDLECGWWCDRSLRRIPVDQGMLRLGENILQLTCRYHAEHPGLEMVYLLGNFGVRLRGDEITIASPPTSLRFGDWCRQGLPFYAGSVTYLKTIRPSLARSERLFVSVPEYRGVAVRVLVDGVAVGLVAWEPNEVDITDCVHGGPLRLGLEVVGHRRNSHGPFHHGKKWPRWTGPETYVNYDPAWMRRYQLVPCGLMAPPRLLVKSR